MVARNQRSGSKSSVSYKDWRSGSEEGLAKNEASLLVKRKVGLRLVLFGGKERMRSCSEEQRQIMSFLFGGRSGKEWFLVWSRERRE